MTVGEAMRRFLRGLLLFAAGALAGGGFVYFAMNQRTVAREQTAPPPVANAPAAVAPPPQVSVVPAAPTPAPVAAAMPVEGPAPSTTLLIPVQGVQASQLTDTFTQARSDGRIHDAIDIMSPAGTPVLAAADGTVAKLFESRLGGTTLYEFDDTGTLAYYYAHLQAYAPGIAEGQALKRGEVIGYVGSSGNASPSAPHLHFAIFVLGPGKHWWQGTAINPYPLLSGAAAR